MQTLCPRPRGIEPALDTLQAPSLGLTLALTLALALTLGCAARDAFANEPPVTPPPPAAPAVWRHDRWLRGLDDRSVDMLDPGAVFAVVFGQLPDEVDVLPTENYFYWQLAVDGRTWFGNIRLEAGRRDLGEVAFAYGEPTEFLDDAERDDRHAVTKTFTEADGVTVRVADDFTVSVTFRAKTVVFRLNRLSQEMPAGFPLAPGEVFLQRTHDESGLRFHLLYQTRGRYFFWVLDDSDPVPERFRPLAPDIEIGRRTGFVFWTQGMQGGRKILASVRKASLRRNDYHDGPFDQLADNFVRGDGLRPFLEEAMPWLRGRVDAWGRFTDTPLPRRVALTVHGLHDRSADAVALIAAAKSRPDPVAHLSRGGRTEDQVASPAADESGSR